MTSSCFAKIVETGQHGDGKVRNRIILVDVTNGKVCEEGALEGADESVKMRPAFLGMGSSLGDRKAHLQAALNGLTDVAGSVRAVVVSPLYESPHLGLQPGDATRYPGHLNCVVSVETTLTPLALLHWVQGIETCGHRQRVERWGPRTIDIDLLLYENITLQSEILTLPHPGINARVFVLQPLFDLVPDLILPNGQSLRELLHSATIRAQKIERVHDDELFI